MKEALKKDVVIKAWLKESDQILKMIKSIKTVRMITKKNLFNTNITNITLFGTNVRLKDIFGLGESEDFELKANFRNAKITPIFTELFKKIANQKNDGQENSLMCIGTDDKGVETIFNTDSFTQKIKVEATKDSQDLYTPADIKRVLLEKIKGSDEM